MEGLGFTKQARRTFHDVPYLLTVSGDKESLSIEVEHAEDGRRWRSKFAARFIEEITQRTGNAKQFDTFVRMLLSALVQESDSVYIDVLTARDLEMLRRHANPQGPPTTSTAGHSDKRYLILTYRAEFDKVHYPLPLPLDERSEEEKLRAMVGRLQSELVEARQTIANLEFKAPAAEGASDERATAALQRQNAELTEALRAARREVEQLRAEFRQRPTPHGSGGGDSAEVHKLREKCIKLQADLKAEKDHSRQQEAQHKQRERELRAEKQKAERLQQQIRKMEEDRRTGGRGQSSERRPSAERSRPASRTPSAERARPPSRPVSRPASRVSSRPNSRASSVASSRERTPSPSGLINRTGAGARGGELRPWAFSQADRPNGSGRRTASPTATLSPYRRQNSLGGVRRTPSPGTRSRERTPSPNQARPGAGGAGGSGGPARPPVSLRDRGGAGGLPGVNSTSSSGRLARPSSSTRPGAGGGGSRPTSASRGAGARLSDSYDNDVSRGGRAGSRGPGGGGRAPGPDDGQHRPGALFGLAANLGLGPGSLAVASSASSAGMPVGHGGGAEDVEACDIDARLQALQSFLKQTKHIAT